MRTERTEKTLDTKRSDTKYCLAESLEQQAKNLKRVTDKYAFKITPDVKASIRIADINDPVAVQYLPQLKELINLPQENPDPIGDDIHTPVKGLVHRHADRVLLKVANVCAVYCRYCFRREMVGPGQEVLTPDELDAALDYIRAHTEIFEVILTGGDPLVLSPRKLGALLDALEDIEHVRIIRIHTRVPVAAPSKVTPEILETLKREKPLYMALHINHAQELTPAVRETLRGLYHADVTMLSQSVLLKNVNDSAETLETLYRELLSLRVKPYYLHHPDMAPGTGHFRLPISKGKAIMRKLQSQMSGLAQPQYMLDIPGGHGKVPINSCYLREVEAGRYEVKDSKGRTHIYKESF